MSSSATRLRVIAAIATLTALVFCGTWQPRSAVVRSTITHKSLTRALGASAASFGLGRLPHGLTLAHAEAAAGAARKFFTLVAADLDSDGDVDVIASNGALDLLVWINDGTGHLTAHRDTSSSSWQARAAGQVISGPGDELSISAQDDDDDVPVARVDLRVVWRDSAEAFLPRSNIEHAGSLFVATHSSRGPPQRQRLL